MPRVTIELEGDQIDHVIAEELKWCLDTLRQDLAREQPRIFHLDPKKDKKKIKKHILAFRKVLSYYGVKDA